MTTDIRLLADAADLETLYAIRYRIYVEEMNRPQKHADHVRRTIRDPLDDTACNFAAYARDEMIGCMRVNFAADGGLDYYRRLLRMDALSPRYPAGVALCTRLMVLPEYRGSSLALRFCAAGLDLGLRNGIDWNFIDCNDHLVGFFGRMGYEWTHEAMHEEYGRVNAMRFDLRSLGALKAGRSPLLRKFGASPPRTREHSAYAVR